MSQLNHCPRTKAIHPPKVEIARIWRDMTKEDQEYVSQKIGEIHELANYKVNWPLLDALSDFWNIEKAVFAINGNELSPTLEEYRQLVQGADWDNGIIQPDLQQRGDDSTLARLFKVKKSKMSTEIRLNGGHGLSIELLVYWIEHRIADKTNAEGRRHAFILLILGTLLFPFSNGLIDSALAKVVLQVVEGKGFVVALLAETIASLNLLKTKRKGELRASPALLQIWFLSHMEKFGMNLPRASFLGDKKVISRMLGRSLFEADDWKALDWKIYISKLTHKDILWTARWLPTYRPAILRCKNFEGVPLLSHRGAVTTYPSRVIRQFGGFQVIPVHVHGPPRMYKWHGQLGVASSIRDSVRQINGDWRSRVLLSVKAPANPTPNESEYRATTEYIHKFHSTTEGLPFNPKEIVGERPERPHASHEDIYATMKARVEIQSQSWAEENLKSQMEVQRLRNELHCVRYEVKRRDNALKKCEGKVAMLSDALGKFKRRKKRVKRFSKCISSTFIRTKEQAMGALNELQNRVKRL